MEEQVQSIMTNGQTVQPGVNQYQGFNKDQNIVESKAFPIENGVHKLTDTATYQRETLENQEDNSNVLQPIDIQQSVATEVPNENHNFVNSTKMRKRKRDCSPFNIVYSNGQDMRVEQGNSPPLSPSCSSMVTVLKFQNGDFVEVPSSLPTYNSPMSLRDMRKAITDSLESSLMQPVVEPKPIQVESPPRQTSPKAVTEPIKNVKEPIKNEKEKAEENTVVVNPPLLPPAQPHEPVKVKKQIVTKPAKKPKSPDKESIKFANRQKELMKLKREMRKRMKMEGQDSELAKAALGVWGRTVGVLCTMCGKHVQKSYGCFRRDNAPEKLMYLFTPGMNRIKICRRCLPYKKQTPGGEEPKNGAEKVNNQKSTNVVKQVASPTKIKEEKPQEKPASSTTMDAIQRKLTATVPPPLYQSSPKMIIGETGKAEAIEYIKMLAGNISSSNDQVSSPVTENTQRSHCIPPMNTVSPLTPVTPGNAMGPNVQQMVSVPIGQRYQTNITPQSQPNILGNVQPGIANKDIPMLSTPPWTPIPLTIKQVTPLTMSPAVPPAKISTTTVQNLTLGSGEPQIIPTAIVVSSQNKTPSQGPVLLQIQRVKLVKERLVENQEMKTNLKQMQDNLGGKEKRFPSAVQSPVVCASCNSSVMKSYRCVNKTQSPQKLRHLFKDESEALRICRKCLHKDGDVQQTRTVKKENTNNEQSYTCIEGEINEESSEEQKTPGVICDNEVRDQERDLDGQQVKGEDQEVILKDRDTIHNNYAGPNEDHDEVIKDLDGRLAYNITNQTSTGINPGKPDELNNTNGTNENEGPARSFEDTQDSYRLGATISNDSDAKVVMTKDVGIRRTDAEQRIQDGHLGVSSDNQGFSVAPRGDIFTESTWAKSDSLLVVTEVVIENAGVTTVDEEPKKNKESLPFGEVVVPTKNNDIRDIHNCENKDLSGDKIEIITLESKEENVESNENSELKNTSQELSQENLKPEEQIYVAIEKETASVLKELHSPEKVSAPTENSSQKKELNTAGKKLSAEEMSSPTEDKSTEKLNLLKGTEKKSRQRSPKASPTKNKIGTRCPQTRGATLKNMKGIESLKETKETQEQTSQGVKRKRQCREKKSKTEDGNEELKSNKQEAPKEVARSPSKRTKTRKE